MHSTLLMGWSLKCFYSWTRVYCRAWQKPNQVTFGKRKSSAEVQFCCSSDNWCRHRDKPDWIYLFDSNLDGVNHLHLHVTSKLPVLTTHHKILKIKWKIKILKSIRAQKPSHSHNFWPVHHHLQSAQFIRSKDKLVCGASVQWGILLFNSSLLPPPSFSFRFPCSPPPSLPPSLSLTVCILPFTLHLAAACCFCWRGKEQDSPGKNLSQTKFPLSLKLPGEERGMEGAKAFSFCRETV